jgi:hypothetical protein
LVGIPITKIFNWGMNLIMTTKITSTKKVIRNRGKATLNAAKNTKEKELINK